MRIANFPEPEGMTFGEFLRPLASLAGRFAVLFGIVFCIGLAGFRLHDNFMVGAEGTPLRKYGKGQDAKEAELRMSAVRHAAER